MNSDIGYTRYLVKRFINQLVDGCKDAKCTSQACHTGRCNTSHGEPVRRYTPRSGRAIAFVLAAEPDPESLLCAQEAFASPSQEGKRDWSDLTQLLADTDISRGFVEGEYYDQQLSIDTRFQELHRLLDLSVGAPSLGIPTSVYSQCLRTLLDRLPLLPYQTLDAAMLTQSQGFNVPIGIDNCEPIQEWLDALSYEPAQRLCARLLLAIGEKHNSSGPADTLTDAISTLVLAMNDWFCLEDSNRASVRAFYAVALMQRAFLAHWDGKSIVAHGSIEHVALVFLQRLATDLIGQLGTYEWLAIIPKHFRPDSKTLAETWLKFRVSPQRSQFVHLLNFKCIFTQEERNRAFRTIYHLRQRQAHSEAEMASALRRRESKTVSDEAPTWRLRHSERHYFVLNVHRENILKDTFDQLWQRRRAELTPPLRVRLGEMEALEVGHDLGGVQIEFFNLICREAFSEDNDLFVTDSDSGYHYFRPMSLEPPWKYELFGVLMALAVHNGITLPVNFPLVFYRALLDCKILTLIAGHEVKPRDFPPLWIKDGWPVLFNSIQQTMDCDIDLEHSYPLEANGLRMTAKADEDRPVTGRRMLYIYEPTNLGTSTLLDADAEIRYEWPGWTLERMPDEASPVAPQDKTDYLTNYVKWIVEDSVWPQLVAFHRGFFSLLRADDLKVICPIPRDGEVSPQEASALKSYIEGTPNVNLAALRRTTVYEGYSHTDPYIQSFWKLLSRWPAKKIKRLVKFVTAAERLPLNMGSFKFVIKKTGALFPEHLPTSSTCFSTLSLPQYRTPKELDDKLTLALEFGLEGFGTG